MKNTLEQVRKFLSNWLNITDLRTQLLCCVSGDLRLNTETQQARLFKHHFLHRYVLTWVGANPLSCAKHGTLERKPYEY